LYRDFGFMENDTERFIGKKDGIISMTAVRDVSTKKNNAE
jgi:hypothetical protein